MANIKNLEGHMFKPGQSGNPAGRPPGIRKVEAELRRVLGKKNKKELSQGMGREEIECWEDRLMSASSAEINLLAQDTSIPIYARTIARAMAMDLKNGSTKTINTLRDRKLGKTAQKVELTGRDGADLMPAQRLSKDEAKEFLQQLDKEY